MGTGAILAIILVSYFMVILDNSIVFTGLARIRDDLGFSTAGLSWVQNAYTLVFGGLLLLGARAGDIFGRRRMFMVGLSIFAAASLAIGAAQSAEWMFVARAVQGVGSAILAPATLSLLTASFAEGHARTRAVAAYGSVAGIGASVGLVLGGVLADLTSWRVGFLINVPIGVLMIIAALRFIPASTRQSGRFDVLGVITSTLGMTALVYGFVRSAEDGWADPVTLLAVAAGAVLLALFVLVESKASQPIMPLRLFCNRQRSGANGARMLFLGAMMGYFFFITQYLQGVLGFSPLQAGLGFLPMTVVNFAVALAIPRLTRRFGNSALLVTGIAVTFAGMLWLGRVGVDSEYLTAVALPMVLIGFGQGLAFAPLTAAGVAGIEPLDAGAGSGLVNVAHQLGGSLGLAVLVAVSAGVTGGGGSAAAVAAEASAALTTGALLLALSLTVAAVFVTSRKRARN
ncbi:MFS transporter [Cryobacterium sp.]|uniref:MFS transporter n=1 Tax=Cryobacterium sp. TaxID=1926290 RepID=UPI002612FEF5|nr:MFS transporter [Cryobacterium sp.]MCU1445793.1 drug resistance efflux protein [Cryobacterium sp.]